MREAVRIKNAAIAEEAAKRNGVDPERVRVLAGCDFCGKDQTEVRILIAGEALIPDVDVHICDECVEVCADVIAKLSQDPA